MVTQTESALKMLYTKGHSFAFVDRLGIPFGMVSIDNGGYITCLMFDNRVKDIEYVGNLIGNMVNFIKELNRKGNTKINKIVYESNNCGQIVNDLFKYVGFTLEDNGKVKKWILEI